MLDRRHGKAVQGRTSLPHLRRRRATARRGLLMSTTCAADVAAVTASRSLSSRSARSRSVRPPLHGSRRRCFARRPFLHGACERTNLVRPRQENAPRGSPVEPELGHHRASRALRVALHGLLIRHPLHAERVLTCSQGCAPPAPYPRDPERRCQPPPRGLRSSSAPATSLTKRISTSPSLSTTRLEHFASQVAGAVSVHSTLGWRIDKPHLPRFNPRIPIPARYGYR